MALATLNSGRSNLLKTGSDFLADELREHASVNVTIIRAGFTTEGVPAIIGRTDFERTDALGMNQTFQTRDFLIHHEEYLINSAQALPETGDRIVETVGGTSFTYEVMPEQGITHDGYSDDHRKLRRIHTKKIGES